MKTNEEQIDEKRLEAIKFDPEKLSKRELEFYHAIIEEPVTLVVMNDPIRVSSGVVYDRQTLKDIKELAIQHSIKNGTGYPKTITCPLTGLPIGINELNIIKEEDTLFRELIRDFVEKQCAPRYDGKPLFDYLKKSSREIQFKALPYLLMLKADPPKARFIPTLIKGLTVNTEPLSMRKQSLHTILENLLECDQWDPSIWADVERILARNKAQLETALDCSLFYSAMRSIKFEGKADEQKKVEWLILGFETLIPYMDITDFKPYRDCTHETNCFHDKLGLITYAAETNTRDDDHYKCSYHFFGNNRLCFGYSAREKKAAVNALKAVVFHGADKHILAPLKHALTNGELGRIFKRFDPRTYDEWHSWTADLKMTFQ